MTRAGLWATAIREGFILLLPLTVVGAIAVGLAQAAHWLPAGGAQGPSLAAVLVALNAALFSATIGAMGLLSAATIAARASALLSARSTAGGPSPVIMATVSAATYLTIVLPGAGGDLSVLGYGRVGIGIVVAIFVAEFGHWWMHRGGRTLAADGLAGGGLLRQALQAVPIAGGAVLIGKTSFWLLGALLGEMQGALGLMADLSLWMAGLGPTAANLMATLANQLLWTVGINGGQVLLHLSANDALPLAAESVSWSQNEATPMFMNAFAQLGGAGATWGLIVAIALRSRDPALIRVGRWATAPAIVNVNEVLLFGLPLIFNLRMVVPFVLAPALNVTIAAQLVELGLIRLTDVQLAWSTPIGVSGYLLTGSMAGVVLQFALVLLSALIYMPYVKRMEEARRQQFMGELHHALSVMTKPVREQVGLLDRLDGIGDVARRLAHDFAADLRNGRVSIAYQPQHDVHGALVGVEALLRWSHVQWGQIPAAAIVNVAEECDLIHDLGDWVVDEAVGQIAKTGLLADHRFTLSLNASPVQLESPRLLTAVASALQKYGVPAHALEIEITEGRALSTSETSNETLRGLQALGVKLSMDDFGMGCTSLLYMQRFSVHSIKLDGALTRDVQSNRVSQEIIRSVAQLGASQGVTIVAEFVETEDQRQALQTLGCHVFQGWLFSKALPLPELQGYIAARGAPPPA